MSSRHLNPYFHWCAGCWDWVCDCIHCVEPLNIKRQPVKDIQTRSLDYDRRRGRLEIEFTWTDDVRQFHPISPVVYRQLLAWRSRCTCAWIEFYSERFAFSTYALRQSGRS